MVRMTLTNSYQKMRKNHYRFGLIKIRRLYRLKKRIENDARRFLSHLLTKEFEKSGIPKGIKADIKKGFKISIANTIKKQIN